MSILPISKNSAANLPPSTVREEDINRLLESKLGVKLSDKRDIKDYHVVLEAFERSAAAFDDLDDYLPQVDFSKYPRENIHRPLDTNKGGWATKVRAYATHPTSSLLAGRTVALKDNIALAGVPLTLGTNLFKNYTASIDATIATRIMDAGATITGKAACENLSYSATSFSSATGMVQNPYADGYSTAGSSSGCARLVSVGAVDMAMGGDQGGSIRAPAAFCGIVGLKPTFGLVPYTGICSMDNLVDHTGPMTQNVEDSALLLQAIAGSDGLDDRQGGVPVPKDIPDYLGDLRATGGSVKGLKIGLLVEGFDGIIKDENTLKLVRAAANKYKELGAIVEEVSVPLHAEGLMIWIFSTRTSSYQTAVLNLPIGRRQIMMTDLWEKIGSVTQESFDNMFAATKNVVINALWLEEKYGSRLYGKSVNLIRKLKDQYDAALAKYDVLICPTVAFPANQHASPDASPLEQLDKSAGITRNTCPTDCTGHPALSLPVGFVPAVEDSTVKLPVGMQIIGPFWSEATIFQVAYAWEKAFDWKTFTT